jgi:hypothetical protein
MRELRQEMANLKEKKVQLNAEVGQVATQRKKGEI